eukprot:TRINITY_DN244_c0_g1_i2.p1 TRINITY_DN244_c0_g1~~TRINITY_DN244_c0_g1_i2.p1  ORF type:complete len:656 (+),score=74.11 TRINITY_DN244_c0_g1_i2:51-2018(+)
MTPPLSGGGAPAPEAAEGEEGRQLNLSGLESPSKLAANPGIQRLNSAYTHANTPVATTDSNTIIGYLQQSIQGKALIAIWGSASENPCFGDLVSMHSQFPVAREFIKICSTELSTLLQSFKILHWLEGQAEVPAEVYFKQSIVAWPITTLVQLTAYYVLCSVTTKQWPWGVVRDCFHSFVTFGKGMLAAVAASIAATKQDYIKQSKLALRASFWVGFSLQDNNDSLTPKIDHRATYVLNVTNIALPVLEKIIEEVNKIPTDRNTKTYSTLEISRILGPRSAFICGHPLDLLRCERTIQMYQQKSGTKPGRTYQPFDGPINSYYYCQRLPRDVVNAWRDDDIEFHANLLKVDVISPVSGKSLRESEGLSGDLAFALTMNHHNLLKFLPIIPVGANFIDVGPAYSGKDLLSKALMSQLPNHRLKAVMHPNLQVVAADKVSPRRSTKQHIRRYTFLKCAIINELLHVLGVLKRVDKVTVELHTSWLELGLTKVAVPTSNTKQPLKSPPESPMGSPKFGGSVTSPADKYDVLVDETTGAIKVLTSDEAAEELELRTSVTLTALAVQFTDSLSAMINRCLPPTLLIMCPTVAALMEVWDVYDLLDLQRMYSGNAQPRLSPEQGSSKKKGGLAGLFSKSSGSPPPILALPPHSHRRRLKSL